MPMLKKPRPKRNPRKKASFGDECIQTYNKIAGDRIANMLTPKGAKAKGKMPPAKRANKLSNILLG
jgi:hypothetical protein